MKQLLILKESVAYFQPPSGGCVLKLRLTAAAALSLIQPPSGGCVLKLETVASNVAFTASRLQAAVC